MTNIDTAIARLDDALRHPSRHVATWVSEGRIEPGARLGAWAGRPDPAALDGIALEHQERLGVPLDPQLRALWGRFDGVAVAEVWDGAPQSVEGAIAWADVIEIGEPVLWKARRQWDPFLLLDVKVPGGGSLFTFGEIADSGWIALAVGDADPAPVMWQDAESHLAPPHRIATDLATFLDAFVDAGLLLPLALRRAGAPGWGA